MLRPICEPIELPVGASVIAERVIVAADAPKIGSFMHFHDVAELVLFGKVRGEFTAGGRRHQLADGAIVFVPSMRHHDYSLDRGAMDWLLVQIDPYIVESLGLRLEVPALTRTLCVAPDRPTSARVEMLGEWLVDAVASGTSDGAVERILEGPSSLPGSRSWRC